MRPLVVGAAAVIFPFNPLGYSVSEACEKVATHLMTNPHTANFFANEQPDKLKRLRGCLRIIEIGGGIVNEHLCRKLELLTGASVVPVYGATELSGVALARPLQHQADWNTVQPLPGYTCEVFAGVSTDTQKERHMGELIIEGPAVANRYLVPPPGGAQLVNGVFSTKDLAVKCGHGIRVLGRLDNCIKRMGLLQSLEMVELEVARCLGPHALAVQVLDVELQAEDSWVPMFVTGSLLAIVLLPQGFAREEEAYVHKAIRRAKLQAILTAPTCFILARDGEISIEGGKLQRRTARSRFTFTTSGWSPSERRRLIRVNPSFSQWVRFLFWLIKERKAVVRPLRTLARLIWHLTTNLWFQKNSRLRIAESEQLADATLQGNS